MQLNDEQIKLLKEYCSATVQNNQEIHPSDMPPVVSMFRLLAEKGYTVSATQVEIICDSLQSLGNREIETSEELKDFLHHVAEIYRYQVDVPVEGKFKRNILKISEDIISEKHVEYSEE